MEVQQIYTQCLAEATYYIQSKNEAAIIDPLRETEPYIEKLTEDKATLKYIFVTHFHADFVSGHVDLAKITGATIVYGPTATASFEFYQGKDNEEFSIGDLTLRLLHTPGHTLESSSLIHIFVIIGIALLLLAGSEKEEPEPFINTYEQTLNRIRLLDKMKTHNVPGVSIAFIKNGTLDWAKGYGVLQVGKDDKINTETMFSVGSVSKVGAAVLLLKLSQDGFVDIDEDVNKYLKSWKIKRNQHTMKKPVTLRATMSHTAGLTVHGFADFMPNERLPTTVQILKGERPAKNYEVYVNIPVGSRFRYSGGGTTVQQLLVEDIMNEKFHETTSKLLFKPLKMNRSSYENPLPDSFGNIANCLLYTST